MIAMMINESMMIQQRCPMGSSMEWNGIQKKCNKKAANLDNSHSFIIMFFYVIKFYQFYNSILSNPIRILSYNLIRFVIKSNQLSIVFKSSQSRNKLFQHFNRFKHSTFSTSTTTTAVQLLFNYCSTTRHYRLRLYSSATSTVLQFYSSSSAVGSSTDINFQPNQYPELN